MKVVFLCCHLSGTGHLVRTLALGRAARRLGHDATVISGGRALAHLDADGPVVQLPPVVVQGLAFGELRTPEGGPVPPARMARRRQILTETLAGAPPDALVTELYPFGRRVLGAEFRHAIAAARAANPACAVLASVRDIPEPKPHRLAETAARLSADYDGVLVHGDAAFLPLSATWPLPAELSASVHHTGYVGPEMPPAATRRPDVLVAVGGGGLGRRLLEVAAEAAARSARPWHLLVGGADAGAVAGGLRARFPRLRIEPARPDYRALLASAAVSVSLCGYNTAVELARCTTPALLVPSEEAGEQEQSIRARRLAGQTGFRLMRMQELAPEGLAAAAEELAAGPPRQPLALAGDDGALAIARIARIVAEKSAA